MRINRRKEREKRKEIKKKETYSSWRRPSGDIALTMTFSGNFGAEKIA